MKNSKIKTQVTVTLADCLTYNLTTDSLDEKQLTIPTSFKTEKGLLKAVEAELAKEELKLIKISNVTTSIKTYSMDRTKFMELATLESEVE